MGLAEEASVLVLFELKLEFLIDVHDRCWTVVEHSYLILIQ